VGNTLSAPTDLPCSYPWTEAKVGCDTIYANPCVGAVKCSKEGKWSNFNAVDSPSPIYAVAEFCNRLFVLLEDALTWGAIDDCDNFDYGRATGAGFQSLNLACFGKPLGMVALRDSMYVFTTNGIMRVRQQDAIIYPVDNQPVSGGMLFNFETVTSKVPACTAQGIAAIGLDNVIWAAEGGFYTLGEGGVVLWQPELSNWLVNRKRCLPTDFCFQFLPELSSTIVRYDIDHTIVYQYDLQKLGKLDGCYDTVGSCDKNLYAMSGSTLIHLDDSTVTPDTFVLTSAARLPLLNPSDRQRREFSAEVLEVFHAADFSEDGDPCDAVCEQSYTVTMASNVKGESQPTMPLHHHCDGTASSSYGACVTGLYHRFRFEGSFHISGLNLQGRVGGLSR